MQIYNILKRLIEKGRTDGLQDKLDVLFAASRITTEQYEELTAMCNESVVDAI